jgi:hypothetical protein
MLFKYSFFLFFLYLDTALCCIKENFVVEINFWFLEPIIIYNMGSNEELIFT